MSKRVIEFTYISDQIGELDHATVNENAIQDSLPGSSASGSFESITRELRMRYSKFMSSVASLNEKVLTTKRTMNGFQNRKLTLE